MKKCKHFEDLIYDDRELNAVDQQALDAHLQACSHCHKVFAESRAIFAALQAETSAVHIDEQDLERYANYLLTPDEPDFSGEFLSLQEIDQIKAHLSGCQKCKIHVDEMLQELQALDAYLEDAGIPNITIGEAVVEASFKKARVAPKRIAGERSTLAILWENLTSALTVSPYLIPAAGVAIIALLVMINPFGGNNFSGYTELSALDQPQFSYLTRSNGNRDLQAGIQHLNNASYTAAIEHLERFIAENPKSDNATYARYLCGVAYLYAGKESDSDIQLNRAIDNLKNISSQTTNLRIKEGAAWYLGKAFLIKKDVHQAKIYFQQVIQLRGRKHQAAQKILTALEKILTK